MVRSLFAAIFLTATSIIASSAQVSPTPALPAPIPIPETSTVINPRQTNRLPEDNRLPATVRTVPSGYVRPTGKVRFDRYVNSVFGPVTIGRNLFNSGVATWSNSPEEWGGQWEGFGRRVASNFGRNVIRQTTTFGLDSAMNLDSHFYRSKNRSIKARIYNAVISPVTARKPSGKRTIGIPRIAGAYGSSIIAYEAWYPSRYDYKDGLKSGTISLGFNAAFNLFREFILKK